jgi:glycosyltransferase involved in cell wall biosynthesis
VNYPKITVVTPSFNQGQFLEETILSVIGQHYPNLEYIVMDGGSTDNSVEVIKKYQKHFTYWVSEKDKGQSDAINRGFDRATGDILCWVNSDDMLMPGVLLHIASLLDTSRAEIICGNCVHIQEGTNWVWGSRVDEDKEKFRLSDIAYIIQPASFWTRKAWEVTGRLDDSMYYAFDWEWQIRAHAKGAEFIYTKKNLAIYRVHADHKTGNPGTKRKKEVLEIYRLHNGEAFYQFALKVLERKLIISKLVKIMRRLHLGKSEHALMKVFMPGLFKDHDLKTVLAIIKMAQ